MHLEELTKAIIGCAYTVANTLGNGFLEKVYENALAHELRKTGLQVKQQCLVPVYYDEVIVGEYFADLLVEERIVVELKAIKSIEDTHRAQCIHYLKATGQKICLLINFGAPRIEIKRIVNTLNHSSTAGAGS
jgi:GxxExxY protein